MLKQPRAASIYCKTDCHFAVMDYDNYRDILAKAMEKKFDGLVNFL